MAYGDGKFPAYPVRKFCPPGRFSGTSGKEILPAIEVFRICGKVSQPCEKVCRLAVKEILPAGKVFRMCGKVSQPCEKVCRLAVKEILPAGKVFRMCGKVSQPCEKVCRLAVKEILPAGKVASRLECVETELLLDLV